MHKNYYFYLCCGFGCRILNLNKNNVMDKKPLRIAYAVFMAAVLAALVVFMILQIRSGYGEHMRIYVALYGLLIIWASFRLYSLVKDFFHK